MAEAGVGDAVATGAARAEMKGAAAAAVSAAARSSAPEVRYAPGHTVCPRRPLAFAYSSLARSPFGLTFASAATLWSRS
jgi:hypothetical protein